MPIVGVAKSGWGLEQFRDYAAASLKLNNMDATTPAAVKLLSLLRYVDGDLDDAATYEAMSKEMGPGEKALYYLEVPPFLFGRIAKGIAGAGRAKGARVMVEKPFGGDLAGAQALNATMHEYFAEDDIYRVDHWLGLDPLDSVVLARFANSVIEPLLNRNYVESIQITMAEAFDVADRGRFYDNTGAIRDVIQNHMLQVLATVMAEPPDGGGVDSWLDSKSRVLGALRPLTTDDAVFGQYDGYHDVVGVAAGSNHRNLRCHQAFTGFVALGRGADRHPRGQDAGGHRDRGEHPVQAATLCARSVWTTVEGNDELRFRIWPETRDRSDPDRQEARRGLASRGRGAALRAASGLGHASLRQAHRGRPGRRPVLVRPAGRHRGRLARRRPHPRRGHPGASLRPRQLGSRRRRTRCCPKVRSGTTRSADPRESLVIPRATRRRQHDAVRGGERGPVRLIGACSTTPAARGGTLTATVLLGGFDGRAGGCPGLAHRDHPRAGGRRPRDRSPGRCATRRSAPRHRVPRRRRLARRATGRPGVSGGEVGPADGPAGSAGQARARRYRAGAKRQPGRAGHQWDRCAGQLLRALPTAALPGRDRSGDRHRGHRRSRLEIGTDHRGDGPADSRSSWRWSGPPPRCGCSDKLLCCNGFPGTSWMWSPVCRR